jgi:hypothetical protein
MLAIMNDVHITEAPMFKFFAPCAATCVGRGREDALEDPGPERLPAGMGRPETDRRRATGLDRNASPVD